MNLLNILNKSSGGCADSGCGCDKSGCASGAGEVDAVTSRRRFLQKTATVTLGAISLTFLPAVLDGEDGEQNAVGEGGDGDENSNGKAPVFGFLVDTERCIGAGKCLTACREENNVPEGYSRTWVERYVHFKDGSVQVDMVPETGYAGSDVPPIDPETVEKSYFVPKLCNQCEDAPCNQVCPVHASYTSPEGVELVDPEQCIGCGYCVQACPYGVRFMNPETHNADKCTFCYHRVTNNEKPACVEACPVNARLFGRLDDPNSEISKRIAAIPTNVLKEGLGTHPKLHYIGITEEVT